RGHHDTNSNKYMRCEKLFYTYDLLRNRYLAVRATPGDWGLIDLALPLTRQTLAYGQPDYLHALFDAGAGSSDAGVRALWDLVDQEHPRLDVTVRACRYPHRVWPGSLCPAACLSRIRSRGRTSVLRPRRSAWPRPLRCSRTRGRTRQCG